MNDFIQWIVIAMLVHDSFVYSARFRNGWRNPDA